MSLTSQATPQLNTSRLTIRSLSTTMSQSIRQISTKWTKIQHNSSLSLHRFVIASTELSCIAGIVRAALDRDELGAIISFFPSLCLLMKSRNIGRLEQDLQACRTANTNLDTQLLSQEAALVAKDERIEFASDALTALRAGLEVEEECARALRAALNEAASEKALLELLRNDDLAKHQSSLDELKAAHSTIGHQRKILEENEADLAALRTTLETTAQENETQERSLHLLEDYQEQQKCMTCMLHDRDCIFYPCGHQSSCFECADDWRRSGGGRHLEPGRVSCPSCRAHATIVKVFRL